ncbi:MAG: hypothetical protein AAF219_10120 [Myxococcota bacterium]
MYIEQLSSWAGVASGLAKRVCFAGHWLGRHGRLQVATSTLLFTACFAPGNFSPAFSDVPDTVAIPENQTDTTIELTAVDADRDSLSFRILVPTDDGSVAADGDLFALTTDEPPRLVFVEPPDFESSLASNGTNRYEVEFQVTDTENETDRHRVAIEILDVDELPTAPTSDALRIAENGTTIPLTLEDPEGDPFSIELVAADTAQGRSLDANLFRLEDNGSSLVFLNPPDFEIPADSNADNTYEIELRIIQQNNPQVGFILLTVDVVDVSTIEATITFPTGGRLGAVSRVSVSGILEDVEDGEVLDSDLAGTSLTLNGSSVDINPTADRFEDVVRWHTSLEFPQRSASLQLMLEHQESGEVSGQQEILLSNDFKMGILSGIAIDRLRDEAVVADYNIDALISVDLDSGNRRIISRGGPDMIGVGPKFQIARDVVVDAARDRALVADSELLAIVAVELASGDRSILSRGGQEPVGVGNAFGTLSDMALDTNHDRVLVADFVADAIVAVSLTSGDRSVLSQGGVRGAGPAFEAPAGIAIDTSSDRALVTDLRANRVVAVDLASGDRTEFATTQSLETEAGSLVVLDAPRKIDIDVASRRAIVQDDNADCHCVTALDLATGTATLLAEGNSTPGLPEAEDFVVDPLSQNIVFTTSRVDGERTSNLVEFNPRLDGGNTTLIFDDEGAGSVGSGPLLGQFGDLTLGPDAQTLIVTAGSLFAVDVFSGDRSLISEVQVSGIKYVSETNRFVGADRDNNALVDIDVATGSTQILSQAGETSTGDGEPLFNTRRFEYLPGLSKFAVVASEADLSGNATQIVLVDETTGDRSVLSRGPARGGEPVGAGESFSAIRDLAFERDTRSLYVVDDNLNAVIEVNITNGDRSFISRTDGDEVLGNGLRFFSPGTAGLDSERQRLLVGDFDTATNSRLFSVDLRTGDRSVFSGNTDEAEMGSGDLLVFGGSMFVDARGSRVFVFDDGRLMAIHLVTGQRVTLSE